MRELAEVQPKSIALNEDFTFKGRLAENYVLQQLCGRSDGMTRYWSEREEKEIDFVIQHEGEIVPVEVKSGEDRRATGKSGITDLKVPYPISKVPYRGGGALGTQVCIRWVHRCVSGGYTGVYRVGAQVFKEKT